MPHPPCFFSPGPGGQCTYRLQMPTVQPLKPPLCFHSKVLDYLRFFFRQLVLNKIRGKSGALKKRTNQPVLTAKAELASQGVPIECKYQIEEQPLIKFAAKPTFPGSAEKQPLLLCCGERIIQSIPSQGFSADPQALCTKFSKPTTSPGIAGLEPDTSSANPCTDSTRENRKEVCETTQDHGLI